MNSLLIALKREKQRKVVTLNASNNKVRRRRWGYGLWGSGTGENGAESPNEENQAEGDASGAEGAHSARHPGDRQIMGSLSGSGGAAIDGDEPGEGNNDGQDNDVEEYSLQEDDWEWHDTEGWVRKAHNIDGGRGGVG
ncbi:hypothetical protein BDZ91DRAFT_723971 [Kalaharituber pfeilii]|nr:hypothetical protein BDZ91DRAFT_723971 [Kalaharituber pfeilii]